MQNEGQSISKKVCFNMDISQQSTSANATTIKLTGQSSSSTATAKRTTATPTESNSKMHSSSGCIKNINSVSKNNFNINNANCNSGSCVDGEKSKNLWFTESNDIMNFIDNKIIKGHSKSLWPVSTSSLCQLNNTGHHSIILDSESEEEEEEEEDDDSVSEMDDGDEAEGYYDEDDVEADEDIGSEHGCNAPSHAHGLLPIFNEIPLVKNAALALDEAAQALHRMRTDNPRDSNKLSRSLLSACADNDINTIKKLLGKGNSSLADSTEEGESLLSLACAAGYYELVQVLLSMNANVDDRDLKNDCTPLMEASSAGHVNVIKLLLEHNADLNAQSSIGYTPLMYTCSGGHVEAVKELLKYGARVEFPNKNGHTPLMEAAFSGHVEVVKILFESGTGTKTQSKEFKESALTLACQKGHFNVVQFLLEAESDHEHKTVEMHTALMEASMHGHVEVAKLLLDAGAPVNMPTDSFEPLLNLVACDGHVSLAMLLIDRGANIEEVNGEGYTPLMEASKEGHEEMVALLINRNANINAQTEETQETALTLACCGGFFEIIRYLIKVGADIELGASSPLMEAAQEGHIDIIKFLLEKGANAHTQSQSGDTALTYACENGHTAVAEVLLNAGAQLEHDSGDGRTPLMKACRAGHLRTVKYLVGKGANVNQQTTCNDHTPLSLACAGGHHLVVDLLLNSGANPYHKLKDNSTMLIESAKGGHTETFVRLLKHPQTVGNTKIRTVKETIQKVNDCKSLEQANEVILNQQTISDINKKVSQMPQQQQQRSPPPPSSPLPITIFKQHQQRQASFQHHPSLTPKLKSAQPKLTSQQQQKIDQLNQLVHHHLSPMQQQQTQNLQTSQQVLQKQLLQTAHMKSSLIQVQESINRAQQQQQQQHQQLLQLQQQQQNQQQPVPQSPSIISSISRQQQSNQVNAIDQKATNVETEIQELKVALNKPSIINDAIARQKLIEEIENSILCSNPPVVNDIVKTKLQTSRNANLSDSYAQNVPKDLGFAADVNFLMINNNDNNNSNNTDKTIDNITNSSNKNNGIANKINIKSKNNIQNSVQKQTFKQVETFNETFNQQTISNIAPNVVIHNNQQPVISIESSILTTDGQHSNRSQSFGEENNILNQVEDGRLNQPKRGTSLQNINIVCDTPSPILHNMDYIDVTNTSHEGATSPGNAFIPTNLPTIQPTHTAPTTVISSFSTATHISAPSEVSQNTAISDRPKVKSVSKNGKNIRKNVSSTLQSNQLVLPISEPNMDQQSIMNYNGINIAAMDHEIARDLDRMKNAQSNGYPSLNNYNQLFSPTIQQNNQQHSTHNLNSIIDSNTPSTTTTFDLDTPLSTTTISISSNKEFTRNEQLQLVTALKGSLMVDNKTLTIGTGIDNPASIDVDNLASNVNNAVTKSDIFQDEVYEAITKPIMLSVEDSDRRDMGNTFLNDVEMTMNGVTTWDQLQTFLANKEYCSEYSEFGGILGYASECKMRWEEDNPHNLMEQIMTGNLSSTEESHHTQSHSITLDSELHQHLHQQLHTQLQNHQVAIDRQGCDASNITSHPIAQTIIVDSDGSNKFEISIESNKIQPPGALQLLFQLPPDKGEHNQGGLLMQLQQEELLYLQHKPQQDVLRLQKTQQPQLQPINQTPFQQPPFHHHTLQPQLHKISDLHQQKLLNAQRKIQFLQQQPSHLSQEQQLFHKKKQQLVQQKILKHPQYQQQQQQRQPVAIDPNQTKKTQNSTEVVTQTSIQQTYQTQVPLNLLQVRKSGSVQLNSSKSSAQQTTDTTSTLAPISQAQKCIPQQQGQMDTPTQNESIYGDSVVNDVAPIQILDDTSNTFTPKTSTNISKRTTDQVRKDRDRFPALRQAPTGSQANTTIAVVPEPKDSKNTLDVNSATDSNNDTALTLACAAGHTTLVDLLLEREASIEHRDKKGFTPLLLSVTAGHIEIVRKLLEAKSDIEAQSERTKDTALSLACSGGKYEIVEILLKAGANKEHRNVSDYTPLSLAASGGYINIIKLLLSNGAEINSRTGSKLGISPLMLAAMNGHTAAVKLLLDMGSDINAQIETNRNTALTLACFQGRHEVVSLLLERKAYVEHRAKTGLTPLMEAASGGYIEVGKVLIAKNADVNAAPVPSSRDTALTIAADKGHLKFVELLLTHNACVEVKNKKGNSPLWLAAHGGHLAVVQVLHEFGAQIDSQDNRKVSCLMAAFRKGHIKVVKWMVNHVAQFPSDQEMTRYVSTISDTEILEKCQDCVSIIRAAKEAQAVKANQIADNLLEELDMESKREENRKAAAARKRERKKLKKMKKKQEKRKLETDNNRNCDVDSEKESQKDDDNDSDKDDDEEDHDDDDEEEYFSPELNEIIDREEPDSGIDANSQGSCESADSKSANDHNKLDKSKLKNFKNKKCIPSNTTINSTISVDKELSTNNKSNKQKEVANVSNFKLLDSYKNEQRQKECRLNSSGHKMDIGLKKETFSNTNNYINNFNNNTNSDNDSEEYRNSDEVKYDNGDDDNKKIKTDNHEHVDDKDNNMDNECNEDNDDDYDHAYDDDGDNYEDDDANNYDNENENDVNAVDLDDDDNNDDVVDDNDVANDADTDAFNVNDKNNNRNNKQINVDDHNITNSHLNVINNNNNTNNDFRYKSKENVQPNTLRKPVKKIEVFEQNKPKTNQDYIHVTSNANSRKSLVFGASRNQMEHEEYGDTHDSTYFTSSKNKNKSFFDDSNNVKSQYMTNNRGKREEGWKEVIRKSSMQQQPAFAETAITKVQVPVHAIARVIGRGGSNINAIRATTGAHIEVEKQGKNLSDRWITIKGSVDATKQSHLLITALIKDPDIDILQMMPRSFTNSTKQSASPSLSIWEKSNISTPSGSSIPKLMVKGKIQQPQNASIANSCNISKVTSSSVSVSGKGPSRSTPSAKTYYTSSQSRTVLNTNVSNRSSIAENATKNTTTKIPGSIPSFVPLPVFTATTKNNTTTPTSNSTIMSVTGQKTSSIIALKDTIKNLPSGPPGTFASKLSSTEKKAVVSTIPITNQHISPASKHVTSSGCVQQIPPPFVHACLQQVQQQQQQHKAIPNSLPSQPLDIPHLASLAPPEPTLQHEQEAQQSAVQLHQINQREPQMYSQVEQNEQRQQNLQMQPEQQLIISPSKKTDTHNLLQPISQTTNLSITQQQQSIQLEESPQNNTIKTKSIDFSQSPENVTNKITASTSTITPVSQLSSLKLISPSLHTLSCTYESEFKSSSPVHVPVGGSVHLPLNQGQPAPAYTLFSDSIFNSAWDQLPPVDERKAPGYRPATPVIIKTQNPQAMQSTSLYVNTLPGSSLTGSGLQTATDDITTLHSSINDLQTNCSNSRQKSISSILVQPSQSPSNQTIQRIQTPKTQSPIPNSINSIMLGSRSSMNTSNNILITSQSDNYMFVNQNKNVSSNNFNNNYDNINSDNKSDNSINGSTNGNDNNCNNNYEDNNNKNADIEIDNDNCIATTTTTTTPIATFIADSNAHHNNNALSSVRSQPPHIINHSRWFPDLSGGMETHGELPSNLRDGINGIHIAGLGSPAAMSPNSQIVNSIRTNSNNYLSSDDIRKIPRPIGTERSWKHGFSTGSGIDQQTDSIIQQQTLQPWMLEKNQHQPSISHQSEIVWGAASMVRTPMYEDITPQQQDHVLTDYYSMNSNPHQNVNAMQSLQFHQLLQHQSDLIHTPPQQKQQHKPENIIDHWETNPDPQLRPKTNWTQKWSN